MKILLVEDDKTFATALKQALVNQRFLVDLALDGEAGWELAEAFEYDLILLDIMLPKLDGIHFCQRLRAKKDPTLILLLTAYDTQSNRVVGLDAGADDYVTKPCDLQELLARIRALLRRGSSALAPVIEQGKFRLDPKSCQVTYDGALLNLTSKEFSILELFLRNPKRIFSQSALIDRLWTLEETPTQNTVRAHIKSLRRKFSQVGAESVIETIYGLGYRLISGNEAPEQEGVQGRNSSEASLSEVAPPASEAMAAANPVAVPATRDLAQPVESNIESNIESNFAEFWQQHEQSYRDRIIPIEQAIAALNTHTLSEPLRQQAQLEAHTLAGSLGSFGLESASQLARQINNILKGVEPSAVSAQSNTEPLSQELSHLIEALRQAIDQGPVDSELQSSQATTPHFPARLLIVDDDASLAEHLASAARACGIEAAIATALTQARESIAQAPPEIVLLDLQFPDSPESGFTLLEELTTHQPPIPTIVLTVHESFAERVRAVRLGGRYFLQKPISSSQVMETVTQVLQQSAQTEAKLLIVDDDPQVLNLLRSILLPWGFHLTLLDDPQQFWTRLEQTEPDLVILNIEMPKFSGIELCQVIRNDPRWSGLPVLFMSAHTDIQTIESVFTAGGDDYVTKPLVGAELVSRILNRLERVQILRRFGSKSESFTS